MNIVYLTGEARVSGAIHGAYFVTVSVANSITTMVLDSAF